MSLYMSPVVGSAGIKAVGLYLRVCPRLKVCVSMPLIPDNLELESIATMLQDLHAKSRSETYISEPPD